MAAPDEDSSSSEEEDDMLVPDFCIILYDPLGHMLRLPRKISRLLAGNEPDIFKLQLDYCRNGPVEADVLRIDDDLFLSRGWAQFVRMNKVKQGHILTFKYMEGNILLIRHFDSTWVCLDCCRDNSSGDEVVEGAEEARNDDDEYTDDDVEKN